MSHDPNNKSAQCVSNVVRALEGTGDYRILKRLKAHDEFMRIPNDQPTKTAIILDVETTGLDPTTDQIIEISLLKFAYTIDGRAVRILDTFSAFNEPTVPIPKAITELTGISDDMVAGHHIDPVKISEFVSDHTALVVAHNAKFDRPFVERKFPVFENVPFACSLTQLEWRRLGFEGARLTHLLAHIGLFHEAHRALDDCRGLLEVLAHELPSTGATILSLLLTEARRKTVRIWAEGAPFDLKEQLKRRKYKWNDGSDGRPRAWYVDVDESLQNEEITFLRKEIFNRDVDLNIQRLDASLRFSNRI